MEGSGNNTNNANNQSNSDSESERERETESNNDDNLENNESSNLSHVWANNFHHNSLNDIVNANEWIILSFIRRRNVANELHRRRLTSTENSVDENGNNIVLGCNSILYPNTGTFNLIAAWSLLGNRNYNADNRRFSFQAFINRSNPEPINFNCWSIERNHFGGIEVVRFLPHIYTSVSGPPVRLYFLSDGGVNGSAKNETNNDYRVARSSLTRDNRNLFYPNTVTFNLITWSLKRNYNAENRCFYFQPYINCLNPEPIERNQFGGKEAMRFLPDFYTSVSGPPVRLYFLSNGEIVKNGTNNDFRVIRSSLIRTNRKNADDVDDDSNDETVDEPQPGVEDLNERSNSDEAPREVAVNGLNLDGTSDESDGNRANLDGTSNESDGNRANLDGISDESDGNRANLDGTSGESDGNRNNLDGTSDESDGNRNNLDGTSDESDGNRTNLDETLGENAVDRVDERSVDETAADANGDQANERSNLNEPSA